MSTPCSQMTHRLAYSQTYLCTLLSTRPHRISHISFQSSALLFVQWLQTALWERHKIQTVRRTLAQLHQEAQISSSGQLSIQDQAVALVYFRAGYAPTDYPSNVEWDIRLACCPRILIMLDMCNSCFNKRLEACTGHVRCMLGLHEGS